MFFCLQHSILSKVSKYVPVQKVNCKCAASKNVHRWCTFKCPKSSYQDDFTWCHDENFGQVQKREGCQVHSSGWVPFFLRGILARRGWGTNPPPIDPIDLSGDALVVTSFTQDDFSDTLQQKPNSLSLSSKMIIHRTCNWTLFSTYAKITQKRSMLCTKY